MNHQALQISFFVTSIMAVLFNWMLYFLIGASTIPAAMFWSGFFITIIYMKHIRIVFAPQQLVYKNYKDLAQKHSPDVMKLVVSVMAVSCSMTTAIMIFMTPIYLGLLFSIVYLTSFIKTCFAAKDILNNA